MKLDFGAILTSSERRIVENMTRGLSAAQITKVLGLQHQYFANSVDNIRRKLGARTNNEIIAKAMTSGLIKVPSNWAREVTLPPHNPFTGPEGTSTMHANSASSGATLNPGPGISGNYKITSINNWGNASNTSIDFPYAVPTVLMPNNGSLVCIGVGNTASNAKIPTVVLVSPLNLEILDSIQLVKPQSGDLAGGIYSYIDNKNNLVLVNGSGYLQWYGTSYDMATNTGSISLQKSVNINQPMVVSLAPDYEGKIWFATQGNIDSTSSAANVGFYDPKTNQLTSLQLPAGEMVANSISSSPAGIAVATTQALYLFRYTGSKNGIEQLWRYQYMNSGYRKPGQLSPGTGATPVFFGPKTGYEYIAITDNGAQNNGLTPAENINVYQTAKAKAGSSQLVASLPFLSAQNSGTENAPIAVSKSVFSPSTYGYWYPPSSETPSTSVPSSINQADFAGGIQRADLTQAASQTNNQLQSLWENQSAKSAALPRLSIADEQIYTITASYTNTGKTGTTVQYYFSAIDPGTGNSTNLATLGTDSWNGSVPQVALTGTYNNNPLQMTGVISPEGVFYQGMASGLFSVEGPQPRYGIGITTNGFSFTNSVSFDGAGKTYAYAAIGEAINNGQLVWNNVEFPLGNANQPNFTWANGQQYSVSQVNGDNVLNIAGAAIGGSTITANIIINYNDGTSSNWTQSFSDWCNPASNPGETIITQQTYLNTSSGGSSNESNNIYGYSYLIPSGKSIQNVTLPFLDKLRIIGIAMAPNVVSLSARNNEPAIGNQFDNIISGNTQNNILHGLLGKDTLTGGGGFDTYVYKSLQDSLLPSFDVITDYGPGDKILFGPRSKVNTSLKSSVGAAKELNERSIQSLLTTKRFMANQAAALTIAGYKGTFLALNDDRDGFQSDSDALIHLASYSINNKHPIHIF